MNGAGFRPRDFGESLLLSYAQILFSNRRWFGALIFAASWIDPAVGLFGLCGGAISNFVALALKFDHARIRSGFYGFNGVLFGCVYGYFYEPTGIVLTLFFIFGALTFLMTAVLEHHLASIYNLPGLSLPFMLAMFVLLMFMRNVDGVMFRTGHDSTFAALHSMPVVTQYLQALALVVVQTHWIAGALVALALLIFSRVAFVLSVVSFAVATVCARLLVPELASTMGSVIGLNAILVGIALGGSLVIPSPKSLGLALVCGLVTIILSGFFIQLLQAALPVLVLPFNLVVMATLYGLRFREQSSGLTAVYFVPGSPEENLYYHATQQARLERIRYYMADLPVIGRWTVAQGEDGGITHREDWRYAWDFVVTDDDERTYSGSGARLDDYYCYRLPVIAPLDGTVATTIDGIPNNRIGDVNLAQNWGNLIVLKHGDGFYSSLSHLEPGSLRVETGQSVKRGELLALCGNSGRSPEPHLHFQFQTTDRAGERTLKYSFGQFVEHRDGERTLRIGEAPGERSRVENLTDSAILKATFGLSLGARFVFDYDSGKTPTVQERWEVKVSVYNTLYIESSAGAWADLLMLDRLCFVTAFRGARNSALYHFYLAAAQLPLGHCTGLRWETEIAPDRIDRSPLRFAGEVLLLCGFREHVRGTFSFELPPDGGMALEVRGRFERQAGWIRKRSRLLATTALHVTADGQIHSFSTTRPDGTRCTASQVPQSHQPV